MKQDGIFAPLVITLKQVVGDEDFNKFRADMIKLHSEVIGSFVETSDSEFGNAVLRTMFEYADLNGNGVVELDELKPAMNAMFPNLNEKQIEGIFNRADKNGDGSINMEEWMSDAPKTLRTNLVKLAKSNGHDLGFLA